jgi:hypothetical protein
VAPADYAQACVTISYAADQHTMRHRGDPLLEAAIGGAKMKRLGRAGWVWHPDGLHAELAAAATLALHASGSDAGALGPDDVTVLWIDPSQPPARSQQPGPVWWSGTRLGH